MGAPKKIVYTHHYVRDTNDLVLNTLVLKNHKRRFMYVSKKTGKHYRRNEIECK